MGRVLENAASKSKAQGAKAWAWGRDWVWAWVQTRHRVRALGGHRALAGPWPAGAWSVVYGEDAPALRRAVLGVGAAGLRSGGGLSASPADLGLLAVVDVWGQNPPGGLVGPGLWVRARGPHEVHAILTALVAQALFARVVLRGLHELGGNGVDPLGPWPSGSRSGVPQLLQLCRRHKTSLVATCRPPRGPAPGAWLGRAGQTFEAWASVRVQT